MAALAERRPDSRLTLAVLGIGTFAIGTDGYIVIGLLDEISRGLRVSASVAGQLVTMFSLTYALCAPVSGWLCGGIDAKRTIQAAAIFFIIGNVICYCASGYPILALGRVVAALGASLYVPLAFAIASRLVPDERRGKALSIVFGGMTVASALGLPLGTYLGQAGDWHFIFLAIAVIGALDLVLLTRLLPPIAPTGPSNLLERLAPIRNRAVQLTLLMTLLVVLSEYTFYSYISVMFESATFNGSRVLPAILLAFGIGAIAGNVAVGQATDALGPRRVLIFAVTAQTALLPILYRLIASPLAAVGVAFCWGVVSYMYLVPIQHKLVDLSKQAGQMTLSLNASAIYIGIGGGGALGGLALATMGVGSLAVLAPALGILSLVIILATF